MKTYKGDITHLEPNQIFVFGSNTQGRHGKGATLVAKEKFGAKYGQSKGLQGQSYAKLLKYEYMENMKNNEIIDDLIRNLEQAPLSSGLYEIGFVIGKVISKNVKNEIDYKKKDFMEGLYDSPIGLLDT